MAGFKVRRALIGAPPVALALALLAALVMMGLAMQNSELFGRWYSALLVINIAGALLLLGLIVLNLRYLLHQVRAGVMGSRLTLRLVGVFALLTVIPVAVVYGFSVQALNRGIDNWFDVRIERALEDAIALSRAALDTSRDDLVKKARDMALEVEGRPDSGVVRLLLELQEHYGVSEITLFAPNGAIVASSGRAGLENQRLVPDRPNESILARVREGAPYAAIDATAHSGLQIRIVLPVSAKAVGAPPRALQVLKELPARFSQLGQNVQEAYAEYERLVYLRGPLKFGFSLMLSLVALLTLLTAVWAAIWSARRLVQPLRDLAEGTRAVAQGNYRKQLPVPGGDELGVLVTSFNDMTRRIFRAQSLIRRNQREAEAQRTYLETVLTHLSSGVLSFDGRQRLRTRNVSAEQILAATLTPGMTLPEITAAHPGLAPLIQSVLLALRAGRSEWQTEVTIPDGAARRVLIVRGTRLPGLAGRQGGTVVVFDDITDLIQAQRDAAWGEVARRLAHEIKNPLTPIRLSAERLRHKLMAQLPDPERETLDRATRTIVEQVDALKSMVNAFSDYARPAPMQTETIDLNGLVRDVVELYHGRPHLADLKLELEPALPRIPADAGRLRQVLHNLLLNAADALAAVRAPRLHIATRRLTDRAAEWIELRVEDNGPGFAPRVMERLFEPYVTTKEKGTGLGLAIVKKIIEEHGGTLRAENPAEGGARVTIRLPVGRVERVALREKSA